MTAYHTLWGTRILHSALCLSCPRVFCKWKDSGLSKKKDVSWGGGTLSLLALVNLLIEKKICYHIFILQFRTRQENGLEHSQNLRQIINWCKYSNSHWIQLSCSNLPNRGKNRGVTPVPVRRISLFFHIYTSKIATIFGRDYCMGELFCPQFWHAATRGVMAEVMLITTGHAWKEQGKSVFAVINSIVSVFISVINFTVSVFGMRLSWLCSGCIACP